MKQKLLAGFLCFLIWLPLLGTTGASAEGNEPTVDTAQRLIDGIVAYKQGSENASDVQAWINGPLTQQAGVSAEWYVLALSQYGAYDFTSYETALLHYLEENAVGSASSRLKYALCLATVGSTDGYITEALDRSVGAQGIMSWIYGLHLQNNGYTCEKYTTDEVVDTLLSLQCEDGGWSLTGQYGDVDVTAMTVQALAPHYADNDNTDVRSAVDAALVLLSERQLEDGDYAGYGVPNPESTAQVLVALSSLGLDGPNDPRFIKNGHTLLDGICKYRLDDGSFCHKEGSGTNGTATVQTLYAMVAYLRMKDGRSPLYILDHARPSAAGTAPSSPADDPDTDETSNEGESLTSGNVDPAQQDDRPWTQDHRPWACLVIVALGGGACLVLFLIKKRHMKNFIAVGVVVALLVCVVCVTDVRSTEDYYNGESIGKENIVGTVTLTIRCDTVAGSTESAHIPADGVILGVTEFDIENGDTVYDILIEAARQYNIQVENDGNAHMAYISGIQYLYEFDFGDLSGWVYHVNGTAPSVGCGEYQLSDGDTIEWLYTRDLGNDVK